jgi:spore coat polysaccharide biosynthesis predicted glycosyltransferase SpsG
MKSDFVIKIFTEGGEKIGFGHISRCTALYDEAERMGFWAELFIQENDYDFTGNCILENRSYSIVNWQSVEYLQSNLDSHDYCIIDSYLATVEVYEKIAQCSAKALYIDDYGRLDYPKGIIVNPSLSTEGIHYSQKSDQEYLLGHEYIILRSTFIGKKKTDYSESVNRVLITLGGTDILNLTGKITSLLVPLFPEISFDIVLGKRFVDQEEWCQYDNIVCYYNLNDKEMCELMLRSDFAITAAGQTIHELLALGLPFFAIQTAENQCNNVKALRDCFKPTVVIDGRANNFEEHIVEEFASTIKKEERFIFTRQFHSTFENNGTGRILKALLKGQQ